MIIHQFRVRTNSDFLTLKHGCLVQVYYLCIAIVKKDQYLQRETHPILKEVFCRG